MNILFVWPAADFSVRDMARGYRNALARAGHDLRDYHLGKRMNYHRRGIADPQVQEDLAVVSRQASENVLIEAIYHEADVVVIVSGLIFHPIGLWLLNKARFPIIIIHTESPYEDTNQAEWSEHAPHALVCTHEITSAEKYGWLYLPHAYDPEFHYPRTPNGHEPIDVLMVGTGFADRVAFFKQIDWTGIHAKFYGLWPFGDDPVMSRFYEEGCVPNEEVPDLYARTRINLNLHRAHPTAKSPNPRAFELAACGCFTLTDHRDASPLGETQPIFETPQQLEAMIRHYLAVPQERVQYAQDAMSRVRGHTFDDRVATMMGAFTERK